MSVLRGKAWVFGDDIDTDTLAPGVYLKGPVEELARHCLAAINPTFSTDVAHGDIVVAGDNFGLGSSREQAAEALKLLGIGAVLARSFARIFYRNALNLGLPALFFSAAADVRAGDILTVDPAGTVFNETTGTHTVCEPIPDHLMDMIRDGGLMPHLKKRLAAGALP